MKYVAKIIELLFPARCASCQIPLLEGGGLCHVCWDQLSFCSPPWCEKCGAPGDPRVLKHAACKGCIHHHRAYDKLRTGVKFTELSKELIHQFKYYDKTNLAPLLSKLAQRSAIEFADADIIAPIPIHRNKLRQRQYNQAALLAKEVGEIVDKPCMMDLLRRIKETRSQVGLSKIMRRHNVRDAFAVNDKYKNLIVGKKVVLIDDVISTGATAHECAKCLKEEGAAMVYVLCIARNDYDKTQ